MQRDINVKPEFRKFFLDRIQSTPIHIEPAASLEIIPPVTIDYWITRLADCGAIPPEMAAELQGNGPMPDGGENENHKT